MVEKRDLQELVDTTYTQSVLAVYVATDLGRETKDAIMLCVRNRIRSLAASPPKEDVERVFRYLDYEYAWQDRGVAIFSAGDALWKTIDLPTPVTTMAHYGERPYVRLLIDLIDRYAEYAVALIDRQSMRLFSVALGRIAPAAEMEGEQVKYHRQGGWSAAGLKRHQDHLALRNMKHAVEAIRIFCEEQPCKHLLLAGAPEVLAQVRELMPPQLQSLVMDEFPASIDASPQEVLHRSLDRVAELMAEEEEALIQETITTAAKGGPGTIGLADTLYALHEGRVRRLLVAQDFEAPGYACPTCEFVGAQFSDYCPFCRTEGLAPVDEAVERAIHRSIRLGVDVSSIPNSTALQNAGGIAAVLRY